MGSLTIKYESEEIVFDKDRVLKICSRSYRGGIGDGRMRGLAYTEVQAEVVPVMDEVDAIRDLFLDSREVEVSMDVAGHLDKRLVNAIVTDVCFNNVRASQFTLDIEIRGDLPDSQSTKAREPDTCPDCNGSGQYVGFTAVDTCKRCEGRGTITH